MIIDNALVLDTETVAVTADQATANYIDFDLVNPNQGTRAKKVKLMFLITTTGTGAGTVNFKLQDDTDSGFATALRTLSQSGEIVGTALTKGTLVQLDLPAEHKRFVRGYVDVTGTVGAFTFVAFIWHGV
jgi:phage-related tail protein